MLTDAKRPESNPTRTYRSIRPNRVAGRIPWFRCMSVSASTAMPIGMPDMMRRRGLAAVTIHTVADVMTAVRTRA